MISTGDFTAEIADLGKAIGLFTSSGDLDVSWFGEPLKRLQSILSNPDQRAALLDLLDEFFPPATNIPDLATGEKWHPLLGNQPLGNLYFTEMSGDGGTVFGMAGEIHGTGATPRASLRVSIPIFEAASAINVEFGSQKFPLTAALTVQLKDLVSSTQLTLNAVRVAIVVSTSPASESVKITLEGLSIDGAPPQDVPLDASNLEAEATQLILSLVEAAIAELGPATGEAAAISKFLLPLLGLSGNVPAFPLLTIGKDPKAMQTWFASLTQGATPQLGTWLQSLVGLLGLDSAVVNTQGTPPNSWQVSLFPIGSATGSNLSLTANLTSGSNATSLQIGLQATVLPSDLNPPVRVEAQAILASIPLAGSVSTSLLPSGSLGIVAPGDSTKTLSSATVTVQSMLAGFRWQDSKLSPVLELDTVTFGGTTYPRIDLTNAESVESTLANVVTTALGSGAGKHLAALAGLVKPDGAASGWMPVDASAFVANPPRAIGQYHRKALVAGQWVPLFTELAELLGLTVPAQPAGAGTAATPWNTPFASAAGDAITLDLVAWNAANTAGDPQQLRIGVRATANRAPATMQWTAELLGFDLPSSGTGNVSFYGGQHVAITLQPIPPIPQIAGFGISVGALQANMDWSPASGMKWNAGITNLSISSGATPVNIASLKFPPAAGFDFSNPSATAAGLGISLDNFEQVIRLMIARASFSWAGMAGFSVSGLLGVHSGLAGLPWDWPTLADPGVSGSLFSDLLAALRNWISKVALGASGNGVPFLMPALSWLNALAGDALPDSAFQIPPTFDLPLSGSGTYNDPWALPMIAGTPPATEVLVWLDSASGVVAPPAAWANFLLANAGKVVDFPSLLRAAQALRPFYPALASTMRGLDLSGLANAFSALSTYLQSTDGVVTPSSAIPTGGQWHAGTTATTSAHHHLPQDPAAISQILTQIDTWAGGATSARTVLLLSPNFGSPVDWQSLLTNPNVHGTSDPSATFNVNVSGADPTTIDLSQVTASVDYYTATLMDDGSGNFDSLQKQIGHIVDRINAIRGNNPITLVAHSTAGLAARAYTAANPTQIRGLITLGTPHGGSPLTFLTDADMGNALRVIQGLLPAVQPSDPLTSAIAHLLRALDGYIPNPTAGGLPLPATYPAGDFNLTTGDPTDTGGKPALALGGALSGDLLTLVSPWVTSLGTAGGNPATPPAPPTHLGFGVRLHIGVPPSGTGDVAIDSSVRLDACRIKLSTGATEPARPAQALRVRTQISRTGGWLVGASSSFGGVASLLLDVRVRWAEVGVDLVPGTSGASATPQVFLHDASYHGPVTPLTSFTDSQAQSMLGAVLQTLTATAPAAGSALAQWLGWMSALKVVVPDPHGGLGVSADAWNAISADTGSFFSGQLTTALSSGSFAGFTGSGPWVLAVPGMPLELYVASAPWSIGVRSTGTGLSLAANSSVALDGHFAVGPLQAGIDATLTVGGLSLKWSSSNSQLLADASPWLAPLTIVPFNSATFLTAINDALPRLLFSATASAIFESFVGTSVPIGPLDLFFNGPSAAINHPAGLGATGGGLDPAKITALLQALNSITGTGTGDVWVLPLGLQLGVTGNNTPAQPTTLELKTTSKIAGLVDLALDLAFDKDLHVTPGGTIDLSADLGGGLAWSPLAIHFGVSSAGVTLSVQPNGVGAVQLLPSVSGLSNLAAGAASLLPNILDNLLPPNPATGSALLKAALDVAKAFNLYDDAGHFSAHTSQFQAFLQTNWTSSAALTTTAQQAVANAVQNLFSGAAGTFPLTVTASGATVAWQFALPTPNAGTLRLAAGWDASGPTVIVDLQGLKLSGATIAGALTGNATATISPSSATDPVKLALSLALDFGSSLPVDVTPEFSVTYGSSGLSVQLLPLAQSGSNGPLVVTIAPTPGISATPTLAADLAHELLVPLAGSLIVEATSTIQTTSLWTGGPTAKAVLTGAGIIDGSGKLVHPLPDLGNVVGKVLAQLLNGLSVSVPGGLKLGAVTSGSLLGISLSGTLDVPLDSLTLEVKFGAPPGWKNSMANAAATDTGLALYLIDTSGSISFHPRIDFVGVGVGLEGADGRPLVKTDDFRLNGADLYLFLSWDLTSSAAPNSFGAGMDLNQLGLPLGAITSGNLGGNPVASSLLSSNSGSAGGDPHPVNPGVDIGAWYWSGPLGDDKLHVLFGGIDGPLWIPVQAGFGPIYIDQLGIEPVSTPSSGVAILIDGSVKVDGLTAQANELGVTIPYNALTSPGDWSLDLGGLGIGFTAPSVTLAGALMKNTLSDGTIEYDGMLLLQITEFGFVAVGAYATPKDASGDRYTSLFVFVGAFFVIGLPPIIEIDGLGLGFGYNREIIPPTDLNQIPQFVLVEALDDADAIANDPMGELRKIGTSLPPKRGSFWLAVGLHGTSFAIVHVTAIVYVALDRGFEIGILGVARMALPSDDTALASLELALKARFSSAEGILSIQAQLTDNSYLISPDCQLTGGFAYFMWFPKSQFVLSVGGYNPHFTKPDEFPDVPRVGYHWSLLGFLSVRGECYFALTNSCVMAGTLFDVSYGPDWLQLWFKAYGDFLASWDPFFFEADVGVSVGATFAISVDLWFTTISVDITVSIGATLVVKGPPLHGSLTVDLEIASVTVGFGPDTDPSKNLITDWNTFLVKYVYGGDTNGFGVAAHATAGILTPMPAGTQPTPGAASSPWQLCTEFTFNTESRMPAGSIQDIFQQTVLNLTPLNAIDVAPMGLSSLTSKHKVTIEVETTADNWVDVTTTADIVKPCFSFKPIVGQLSEATWHTPSDPTNVPAAANTVSVILGVTITATATPQMPTAMIPIGTLSDDFSPRPLPFAQPIDFAHLKLLGGLADTLSAVVTTKSSRDALLAASKLLSGDGFFAQARTNAGLPAAGMSASGVRSLLYSRSAPPRLAPITTGLTMKPVGLASPPILQTVPPVVATVLAQPRLRAVLQANATPVADAPPSQRTTVSKAPNVLRVAPPSAVDIAGAKLVRVKAAQAPARTSIATIGREFRHADLGHAPNVAQLKAQDQAAADFAGAGVSVAAGVTHLWDIPDEKNASLFVKGDAARVTCLDRGGRVLSDQEFQAADGVTIAFPNGCAMVAVTCLGKTSTTVTSGFGSLTLQAGVNQFKPIVGWQMGNLIPQVSGISLLGRGCCLVLSQHNPLRRTNQQTSQAMVRLGTSMLDKTAVETWLPTAIDVVMVLLDQNDASAAAAGDLQIALTGITLSDSPLRVQGGTRMAFLYSVTNRDAKATFATVAVASLTGWRISGVLGLMGKAQEWAVNMNGGIPAQLVPNGPFTPDGQITVQLKTKGGDA